jgi:hypothetical protein
MTPIAFRLVPALYRFVGAEVIRARRVFYATLFVGVGALAFVTSARSGSAEGFSLILVLGLWGVAAPLCRPWIDDDIRLGYGALWLQKPVRPLQFYSARLLALIGWSLTLTLAMGSLFLTAGLANGRTLSDAGGPLLGVGWIPTMLVVLAFLGSALGARNSALFAYGALFAGFGLQGLADTLSAGPIFPLLETVFPPAYAALGIMLVLEQQGLAAALVQLLPILMYMFVCALLGLLLTLGVPRRLAGAV